MGILSKTWPALARLNLRFTRQEPGMDEVHSTQNEQSLAGGPLLRPCQGSALLECPSLRPKNGLGLFQSVKMSFLFPRRTEHVSGSGWG